MLPVRVKVISSSSCSLSEASELLKQFVTSDPSSDSYAKSYVKNVVLALDECLSRRAEGLTAIDDRRDLKERKRRHLIGSPDAGVGRENFLEIAGRSELQRRKQKHSTELSDASLGGRSPTHSQLRAGGHAGLDGARAGDSGMQPDHVSHELQSAALESVSKKHKRKKKRHSTIDDTADLTAPSEERAALAFEDGNDARSENKRRKEKKESGGLTANEVLLLEENFARVATVNNPDSQMPREYQGFATETKKRRKKGKHSDPGMQT